MDPSSKPAEEKELSGKEVNLAEAEFVAAIDKAKALIEAQASKLVQDVDVIAAKVFANEPIAHDVLREELKNLEEIVQSIEFVQSFAASKEAVTLPLDLSFARVLALSTAKSADGEYLTYAKEHISAVLGTAKEITFIPYALDDHDAYTAKVRNRFELMGYTLVSVHESKNPVDAILSAEAVFVGGGNTFRLLRAAHETGVFKAIRERVEKGMPYIGASAGSNFTMRTAGTTNDMPIVERMIPELIGLHFFPFALNPHYVEKVEGQAHLGESRDLRIEQFHQEQADIPVIGLSEGAGIRVIQGAIQLVGAPERQAVLFRAGKEKEILTHNQDLSALVMTEQ